MNFNKRDIGLEEYPVDYYYRLLKFIKEKHKNQYWLATPQEVSDYIKKHTL
jgi:hypothetical protein